MNKVPFGTLEPYGDRARRREGFEPHDLRVIAPRPSSSRVVLRARQAALPKLALWKTPLAKTPCLWLFGFADPTSLARRSHNTTKEKTARWAVSLLFGASGDTELFEKASNINGFQGGRVANNLYISPFRATVFKTAALFLYLNSSVVIRVRKPLLFPPRPP